jgi:hypothetical protein
LPTTFRAGKRLVEVADDELADGLAELGFLDLYALGGFDPQRQSRLVGKTGLRGSNLRNDPDRTALDDGARRRGTIGSLTIPAIIRSRAAGNQEDYKGR